MSVAGIAADVGWSRKHLTNRFREQAGLPPKVMARVLRFRRAVDLLGRGTGLAEAAFASGYYDQAHLNREFRALSGWTPTELIGGSWSSSASARWPRILPESCPSPFRSSAGAGREPDAG